MIGNKLELSDIEFSIECLPEYIPIKGNVMASGNDEYDRRAEEEVECQLDAGNEWAWCNVKVIGRYKGLTAFDTLGACSYENKKEFINGGYYLDMQTVVLGELQNQLDDILEGVDKVSE